MEMTAWFQSIPTVTLLVLGVSIILNLITNIIIKLKVDVKTERLVRIESNEAMKEYREALKSGDQSRIDKAKKKQRVAQEKMMKTSSARLMVSFYFMFPLLAVLWVFGTLVGYSDHTAVSPYVFNFVNYIVATKIPGSDLGFMNFITWYFVASLVLNLLIARAMGTNP
jgi:uncharacterized membrane protein (DUF106 family)